MTSVVTSDLAKVNCLLRGSQELPMAMLKKQVSGCSEVRVGPVKYWQD